MAKKPKYVAPDWFPPDPQRLVRTPCKGGPLTKLTFIDRPAAEHKVLDVGTYVLQGRHYVWVPNPDSPARRAERERTK